MGLPLLSIAKAGASLYAAKEATGVLGFDDWLGAVARIAPKLLTRMHSRDRAFGDDMVALARSRVPQDTGRLFNGIDLVEIDDETLEFRASAVHEDRPNSQEDYAHFVEFGTAGGVRGQSRLVAAESAFFAGSNAPPSYSRKSLRTHPGTPPQPFFYNSAEEVLAKRGVDLDDAVASGLADVG